MDRDVAGQQDEGDLSRSRDRHADHLSRLEPGAGIPAHVHEDLEQTFVLEGSLVDQEGECTAGNFVIRAKGSRHAPTAPKGCTMLVFFLKPTAGLKKALLKHA